MNKYIIISLFIILTLPTQAFEIIKRKNKLILQSSSRQEMTRITLSLKEWMDNLGENKRCNSSIVSKISRDVDAYGEDKTNFFSLDISDCVPKHVLKYQGSKPEIAGPNCWNLALVMKNILPALRYSSAEEMSFYTRPPLCRQLSPNEARKAGDLGAIRSIFKDQVGETHGFIYISEDTVYSKNGSDENAGPYELQSFNDMLKLYEVPKEAECRENAVDLKCSSALSFFRCISMEQYLKENPFHLLELNLALSNISHFEECLQTQIFNHRPLSELSQSLISNTANALTIFLKSELAKASSTDLQKPENAFLLGSLQLRLQAISEQLYQMNEDDLNQELEEKNTQLSELISASLEQLKRPGK